MKFNSRVNKPRVSRLNYSQKPEGPVTSKKQKITSFFNHIFSNKYFKISLLAVSAVLIFVVILQLLWPSSKARPFSSVAGLSVGLSSKDSINTQLKTINNSAEFNLVMGSKTIESKFSDSSININPELTAEKVTNYPIWKKLIPLSLFIGNKQSAVVSIDQQNLKELAAEWSKQAYVPEKNATIVINGTSATINKEESGRDYRQEDIVAALGKANIGAEKQTVLVKRTEVKPARTEKDVKKLLAETIKSINNPLTLEIEGKKFVAPSSAIAKWITFTEKADDKKVLELDINKETLNEYLKPFQQDVYKKPGVTTVSIIDGEETGRNIGEKGKGLDVEKSTSTIKKALIDHPAEAITLTVGPIEPTVQFNKTFTKTNKGLSALLADIAKQKGDYAITVRQLGGYGLSGSYNGNKQYHPASTYKLFVAYSVLKRIESGELKWEDEANSGNNIDRCFELMIVNSNNACAEWFGEKISWQTIHSELRALGLGSTTLIGGSGFRSTTDDQVKFLAQLNSGTLLKEESNKKLLSAMSRQIYRAGIPTGFGGDIANKVGFFEGLFHDSAIVSFGGNTYLISIYSNGSSWSQLADAAKQIKNYFVN
jgi:beta-lactamase class A